MKKEMKHKKINKSVCMSEKISNYFGLPLSHFIHNFNHNDVVYPR